MLWIQLALTKGHGRDFAFVIARRKMPQTEMPSRALGWFIPILKKRSSYGHPR